MPQIGHVCIREHGILLTGPLNLHFIWQQSNMCLVRHDFIRLELENDFGRFERN